MASLGVKTPWGGLQDEREINNVWGFKGFDQTEGSQEGEKRTFEADKGMETQADRAPFSSKGWNETGVAS